jgi:hypothetical protein
MPDVLAGFRCYPYGVIHDSAAEIELLRAVRCFASESQAPALLRLVAAVLGVDTSAGSHRDEILRFCRALASEGGLVQEMAAEIGRELARQ